MSIHLRLAGVALIALLILSPPAGAFQPGYMTGSGNNITSDGLLVGHHFELHCEFPRDAEVDDPNHLVVTWEGNTFFLEELTKAGCEDRNRFDQRPPAADFDTYNGEGTGRCNHEEGPASAKWEFTDQGEPGSKDTAWIEVECPSSTIEVQGKLQGGNHQAHEARP